MTWRQRLPMAREADLGETVAEVEAVDRRILSCVSSAALDSVVAEVLQAFGQIHLNLTGLCEP
ncbi:hypothetical protein [Mycolicibacterium sp. P9-22]|uniref:hypothetical protein n=1 Tax=Mycolicibacterium sp. P9-22 TaxID=2024613 RepID=UPI0011EFD64C|nr:hypothetical protein [Mycolicibacterium sp. P9-22]